MPLPMKSLLSLPDLPKPGQRIDLPPFSASADALALSRLAHPGRLLVAVSASPLEAQRLEIGRASCRERV